MNILKKLFMIILILMPLSAIFASGASCDITASPATVDIDNDFSQNPGRTTVFGYADGKFNENTKVEINCNVDGTLPGANENIAAAKITASVSQLSYTGYCTYKPSSTYIGYRVSVSIQLDDVVCAGGFCYSKITCNKGSDNFAKVVVKASTKGTAPVTPTPAPECGGLNQPKCSSSNCPTGKTCYYGCYSPYVIAVPTGTCVSCDAGLSYDGHGSCVAQCGSNMVYDNGNCVSCGWEGKRPCSNNACNGGLTVVNGICEKSSEPQVPPQPPKDEKELRFSLDWTWSLIGVPYGDSSSEDHSCVSAFYYYDKEANKYQKIPGYIDIWGDKSLIGKGLWAKRKSPKSESGDCIIKYKGKFLASQTIELKKGWNLVSIQTKSGIDATKSNCNILKGPFTYSGFIVNGKPQGYYKRDSLNFGTGYWIKVADNCKLSIEEEEDQSPPSPPE